MKVNDKTSQDRLIEALWEAKAPSYMVNHASMGDYNYMNSLSRTPVDDLIQDCIYNGLSDLARRAEMGEFDPTLREIVAWFKEKRGLEFK